MLRCCAFHGFAMDLMLRAMLQVLCGSTLSALYDLAVVHRFSQVCDGCDYSRHGTGALWLSARCFVMFGNAQGCVGFAVLRWI